jgi:DNA-binding beta-propeller fold protein YncE
MQRVFYHGLLVLAAVAIGCARHATDDTTALVLEVEWGGHGSEPGQLDHPSGVAVGPDGNVYVADSSNARIQVFTRDGDVLAVWPLPDGSRPVQVAPRADGTTLVADFTGDQVLVLDTDGRITERWRGPADGPGFQAPSGLAVTSTDTVFLVTFMGQRVYELSAQGDVIRYLDGGETAGPHVAARAEIPGMSELFGNTRPGHAGMGATGLGDPHGLYAFPSDVAVAPDGTIYVSNTHAYELLVFEPSGTLRAAWGTKGSEPGQWEVPVGLTVDPLGRVFVADSANFRIQVMDPDGTPRLTSRADERWYRTTERIYSPTDVAVDPGDGRLFVTDFAASKLQRFRVELQP